MEIIGTHVLYGFIFTHKFWEYGSIRGNKFKITYDKVYFKYNLKQELQQKLKDICDKIPLVIMQLQGEEREDIHAIGFEVAYFGKYSKLSIAQFSARMKLCEDEVEKDFMNYTLSALRYDCGLESEEFDYISVPHYIFPYSSLEE